MPEIAETPSCACPSKTVNVLLSLWPPESAVTRGKDRMVCSTVEAAASLVAAGTCQHGQVAGAPAGDAAWLRGDNITDPV